MFMTSKEILIMLKQIWMHCQVILLQIYETKGLVILL